MIFINSLLHFLYPPICLCCQNHIDDNTRNTLCSSCFNALQLLDLKERCPRCLHPLITHSRCYAHSSPSLKAIGACFEESPQVNALLGSSRAAEYIAPFLMLQNENLRWPLPDLILPPPHDRFCTRHSMYTCLAKELAIIMQRPCKTLLGINRLLLPFPLLSLEEQPIHLSSQAITLYHPEKIVNTHVLIVQPSFTPSVSLAAQTLMAQGALSVRLLCVTAPSF